MRITLFASSLAAGGAERALTVTAIGLQRRGHSVTVLTWMPGVDDFYALPSGIARERVPIGDLHSPRWFDVAGNVRRLSRIRQSLLSTNPDAVISYLDGTNELLLLATVGSPFKKFASCQIDMTQHPHYNDRWAMIRRLTYRFADAIVFLDQAQADYARLENPSWTCKVIPNPASEIRETPGSEEVALIGRLATRPHWLVAMGRLVPQKGFDLLISCFKIVANEFPDWNLLILGEGPMRNQLQADIDAMGLSDRVLMPGLIKNPHPVMMKCDIFVLSSRYEGQPLALIEALSCGLPAVSFDCPSGPRVVMRDGIDGLLVEPGNVAALADALGGLMADEERRTAMAQAAPAARERFSADAICARWEALMT